MFPGTRFPGLSFCLGSVHGRVLGESCGLRFPVFSHVFGCSTCEVLLEGSEHAFNDTSFFVQCCAVARVVLVSLLGDSALSDESAQVLW